MSRRGCCSKWIHTAPMGCPWLLAAVEIRLCLATVCSVQTKVSIKKVASWKASSRLPVLSLLLARLIAADGTGFSGRQDWDPLPDTAIDWFAWRHSTAVVTTRHTAQAIFTTIDGNLAWITKKVHCCSSLGGHISRSLRGTMHFREAGKSVIWWPV